ncbi:hypothetical protein PIB30_057102 [Stylosanthes scabra]|uniref:Uncharacterized protein n=1 Tax=Stylosanthes scabra TaxID=79078 RepID=A0ABU6WKR3_9FABA|nr:hypothetical protein [Stylosanthes scabra]
MKKGTEKITTVFKSCYKWYVPHFHLAPKEAINTWWDEWKKAFRFRKGESEKMHDAWLARAAKRLRELFHDDILRCLKEYWASEEYQALKRTNKANRASSAGGSLHTRRSITYPATTEKMELGCTPTQSEVFTRTHKKKKDRGQWVDKRVEDTNQLYEEGIKRLEVERVALIAAGCPEPPIDYDEVWARIAGGRKRGRVYGRGKVPSRLKPPVYDSDDFSIASAPVDMREQIRRLQSSFDTQTAEFDRWKSTVSQMYNFMQNMQVGSTTSNAGMPSSMPPPPPPPPPLQHGPASATDQPPSDEDRSLHDDPDNGLQRVYKGEISSPLRYVILNPTPLAALGEFLNPYLAKFYYCTSTFSHKPPAFCLGRSGYTRIPKPLKVHFYIGAVCGDLPQRNRLTMVNRDEEVVA